MWECISPFVLASLTINLDSLTSNYHDHEQNFVPSTAKQAIHIKTPNLIQMAFPKSHRDRDASPRYEKIKRKQERARNENSEYSKEWYSLRLSPDRCIRGKTRKKVLKKGSKGKSGGKVDYKDYLD
jgi:hypothetical protein